jgi:hypothetical protein
MDLGILAGVAGGAIGSMIPGVGTALGFSIGMTVGGWLFPPAMPSVDRGKITDLRVQGASQGTAIPILYGRQRPTGVVIWSGGLKDVAHTTRVGGGLKGGSSSVTDHSATVSMVVMACEGPVHSIRRVYANHKVIYENRGGEDKWADGIDPDSVEFFYGTSSQAVPGVMLDAIGAADCPACRGIAGIAFDTLDLAQWGNQIPLLEFEVQKASTATQSLETICLDLGQRVGRSLSDMDYSALAGIQCRGLLISSRMDEKTIMDTLATAYLFDWVEVDGKMKAVLRGGAIQGTIDGTWLGAALGNKGRPSSVEITRRMETELPRRVDVQYVSEALDFQSDVQFGVRETGASEDPQLITLPIVMTATEAKRLADVLANAPWINRVSLAFTLSWRYLKIAPGDLWNVPVETPEGSRTYTVLIKSINMGLFGHLEVEGVEDDPSVYTQVSEGAETEVPDSSLPESYDTRFVVVDLNALWDDDAARGGWYGMATNRGSGWPGSEIRATAPYPRDTASIGWYRPLTFSSRSTAGAVIGTVPATFPDRWDRTTVITVELDYGALISVTEAEVLAGANLCVIGNEILQFATATLIADRTYELSNLIRGRRGTEWAMAHADGDTFWMADGTTKRFEMLETQRGQTFTLTHFDFGTSAGTEFTRTLDCNSRKPYAPALLKVEPSGSDRVATWTRRARTMGGSPCLWSPPLDETTEEYDVVVTTTGGTVKRTTRVVGATTWTYTAAQRTTDGLTGSAFKVQVYQITTFYGIGRGFKSEVLVAA